MNAEVDPDERAVARAELGRLARRYPAKLAAYGIATGVGALLALLLKFSGVRDAVGADVALSIVFGVSMGVIAFLLGKSDEPERPTAYHAGMAALSASSAGLVFWVLMTVF